MPSTYVDANVLIAAAKGRSDAARRAIDILDDPYREFAASDYLRLEVVPKAVYFEHPLEVAFYDAFFRNVARWADCDETLINSALAVATEHGLAATDALHVAAAKSLGANVLVTGERPTKPMFRVRDIAIHSLHG